MDQSVTDADLDAILSIQLTVAWAGEGATEPPRLGWWRTALHDPDAGLHLFNSLLPKTARWAVLEAAREAARRVDAASRQQHGRGDDRITLYHFGFELDERLQARIVGLKQGGGSPGESLAGLDDLRADWDEAAMCRWLSGLADFPALDIAPGGRQLREPAPVSAVSTAKLLARALLTENSSSLPATYPMPFFGARS